VVRTHVAVITAPTSGGQAVSIQPEIELVKAAVLYADTVEVLSLGNQLIRTFDSYASGGVNNFWAMTSLIGDSNLRQLDPNIDIEQLTQVGQILANADIRTLRATASADPTSPAAELIRVFDELETTGVMAEAQAIVNEMRLSSGVDELDKARRNKFVRFNENVPIHDDSDTVITAFSAELRRYLQDPTKFVLLDSEIAGLARSMIDEGFAQPPRRALSNAGEAAIGTGFIARLPAFTKAPMDELLDLRQDLDDPLSRYRGKVALLRNAMQTGPFDQHREAEIDASWRTEVEPALRDIRHAMADHGLVREFLRALGGDLATFIRGTGPAAALGVVAANTMDLETALSAGVTLGAAVAPSVAQALVARQNERSAAQTHDLFYLYETNRRLRG
jgi:hypothetical protein